MCRIVHAWAMQGCLIPCLGDARLLAPTAKRRRCHLHFQTVCCSELRYEHLATHRYSRGAVVPPEMMQITVGPAARNWNRKQSTTRRRTSGSSTHHRNWTTAGEVKIGRWHLLELARAALLSIGDRPAAAGVRRNSDTPLRLLRRPSTSARGGRPW